MTRQKTYISIERKNGDWCVFPVSILLFITMTIGFFNALRAQSYKENTGFLLQKVEPLTHYYYIQFKHGLVLPYFYGYYIVTDEVLQEFFVNDSVDYNRAIMLCDPATEMFADSAITKEVMCFTRIKDILLLDDSELYKIGQGMYIIRKMRYAYFDNAQVKIYIKSIAAFMWDDISDDDLAELYMTYEVGQLYEKNYYQCYHHLIELLPTPPQIYKYVWRKLYQFGKEYH